MNNNVSLEYLDNYDIEKVQQSVENSFSKLNVESILKNKKCVLLKVCAPSAASPDTAETTHPTVVRAVVNILSKQGIKCVVAESPYGSYSSTQLDSVYFNSGLLEVANQTDCELNRNLKTFSLECADGVLTKKLILLDVINDVDAIINISKLKLSSSLGYLGSTSNLFGLIPGELKTQTLNRLRTLKDFYNFNLDLYLALQDKLVLNIIDAVVAMEAENTPRLLSCIGMAENSFALDSAMIDILNINHDKTILKTAKNRNLFNFEKPYKLINEKLENFKLEDFALIDFDENLTIHKSETERKRKFKSMQQRVVISEKKCKGCGICTKICPTKALTMKYDKNGELYTVVDYSKCIFCFKCVTACPYNVVEVIQPNGYKKLHKELNKYNQK